MRALSLSFNYDDELRYLRFRYALLSRLRYLDLHGPISWTIMYLMICCLSQLRKLLLDGPIPNVPRHPTFALDTLGLTQDVPFVVFHRISLFFFVTLTTLGLAVSDEFEAPELCHLVVLRELKLLQPFRGIDGLEQRSVWCDRASAVYIERVLVSAQRLPRLHRLAFLDEPEPEPETWPDLRSKSRAILGALPNSLVVLSLTSAAKKIDLEELDKLVRNPNSRPKHLQDFAMDEAAKGQLPFSADECERDWAANGVRLSWTQCRAHTNVPLLARVEANQGRGPTATATSTARITKRAELIGLGNHACSACYRYGLCQSTRTGALRHFKCRA